MWNDSDVDHSLTEKLYKNLDMTKSTQQLADELARKLCDEYHGDYSEHTFLLRESLKCDLFKTIPLLELLRVARAAKEQHEKRKGGWANLKERDSSFRRMGIALTNLQKKVEL